MRDQAIKDLVGYAFRTGLIEESDRTWAVNALLEAMRLDSWEEPQEAQERPLEDILRVLLDDAAARGLIHDDVTSRDLFDTALLGRKVDIFSAVEENAIAEHDAPAVGRHDARDAL